MRMLALLGEKQTEKLFFPAIKFRRSQTLAEKKLTWDWPATGHKIYPSALRSFTMCPHRYIHEDVRKPPNFPIESFYKMEVGTALHKMYQECAETVEELLWEDPDFSNVITESRDLPGELTQKHKDIRPEVPVFDMFTGISGRADAVINCFGEPVVFDLKTTSVEDVQKEMKLDENKRKYWTGKYLEGCWEQYQEKLPSEDHKIQVGIYCYFMNKYKYYSKPIRKAGLGYVNLLMKAGDPRSEFETYFDFTEEMEAKIGLLLEHIGIERMAYLEGRESQCSYPQCRSHHLRRSIPID